MNISVVGTGYVGLVSGTCFSEIGHNVTCVDIDAGKIERLKKGDIPIYEPGLSDVVLKNLEEGRLSFSTDLESAVHGSEIVIIAVGTPPKPNGEADLTYIFNAAETIGKSLNGYKVIVTKSTVPLGTNVKIKEIIKEASQGKYDFDIASNPEFLREGSALYDTMNMERAVIGTQTKKAAEMLEQLHSGFHTKIIHTDVATAELIKYASNSFLATKISFINEIANIAEHFGADVSKIAEGMGTDNRIGPHFLNAGLGYGGSCFPKDISALISTAKNINKDVSILEAVDEVNKKQRLRIVEKLSKAFNRDLKNKKVAVLGLAFKPNTDDMRDAPSITIINELVELGAIVKAYDPIAINNARKVIENLDASDDLYGTIDGADAVVIVTEWKEVKELDLVKVKDMLRQPILIDGRNVFSPAKLKSLGYYYDSIGRQIVGGSER